MYIKIMKPSGGFQLLECSDYVEIMDRSEDVKEVVYFMKDDESCREWKVEVTGDVYIVNEEGKTVSYYKHNQTKFKVLLEETLMSNPLSWIPIILRSEWSESILLVV